MTFSAKDPKQAKNAGPFVEFVSLSCQALAVVFFCGVAHAAMWEVSDSAPVSASAPAPAASRFRRPPMEALIGPSIFKGKVGLALATRVELPKNFAFELGGVIPHNVSGFAEDQKVSGILTTTGHVSSFSEAHMGLLYSLYRNERIRAEAGAGLSLGMVGYRLHQSSAFGTNDSAPHRTRASPWLEAGASVRLYDQVSFLLRAVYVRYGGSVALNGASVDLDFSGVMIEPSLQVKF